MKLLHLDSSIHGADSVSRQLSAAVVGEYRRRDPGLEVVYRDLAAQPLPHIDLAVFTAGPQGYPREAGPEIAESGVVLDEFLAAEIVVIGAPMYNFAIPSQLKAWIDRIVVPGKTFKYEDTGPKGLAAGKTVVVASSRGGLYGEGAPMAAFDHQETHLRAILGFLGIQDIRVVRAEGVAYGPEHRQQAISKALATIPDDLASVSVAV